jgi:hypothetical protein
MFLVKNENFNFEDALNDESDVMLDEDFNPNELNIMLLEQELDYQEIVNNLIIKEHFVRINNVNNEELLQEGLSDTLKEWWEAIKRFFAKMWESIKSFFAKIGAFIKKLWTNKETPTPAEYEQIKKAVVQAQHSHGQNIREDFSVLNEAKDDGDMVTWFDMNSYVQRAKDLSAEEETASGETKKLLELLEPGRGNLSEFDKFKTEEYIEAKKILSNGNLQMSDKIDLRNYTIKLSIQDALKNDEIKRAILTKDTKEANKQFFKQELASMKNDNIIQQVEDYKKLVEKKLNEISKLNNTDNSNQEEMERLKAQIDLLKQATIVISKLLVFMNKNFVFFSRCAIRIWNKAKEVGHLN